MGHHPQTILDTDSTSSTAGFSPRERKFRQAAFVYLHVGILYEGSAWKMWQAGLLPERMGPGWLWMLAGGAITGLVFWGLWSWQNVWLARVVWFIGAMRVPTLIGGAFLPNPDQRLGAPFYGVALLVVVINLWMLARAGWDL